MKKIILMAALVFAGTLFAQEVKPKFEQEGELIKGTFFYEDGAVKQKGTYKNGKLHGKWIAYDTTGKKTAVAQYANGQKTGKWFFWNNSNLTEVDYSNNSIAEVTTWDNSKTLVVRDTPLITDFRFPNLQTKKSLHLEAFSCLKLLGIIKLLLFALDAHHASLVF